MGWRYLDIADFLIIAGAVLGFDPTALGSAEPSPLKVAIIVTDKSPTEPRASWISTLDAEDIPNLAAEVAEGFRFPLETGNPEPLRRSLYAWKSTADYALTGPHRELEKPDWDAVVRIMRPADEV